MALIVQHPKIAPSKVQTQEMPIGQSSFLQNVVYDAANATLTVTMLNGAQYQYSSVPSNVMEDWAKAPSKGEYYGKYIRGRSASSKIIDKNVGPPISKKT